MIKDFKPAEGKKHTEKIRLKRSEAEWDIILPEQN